ncbi:hypothetical protein AB3X91_41755, partial [Paraburkholderia sp. BR14263]|uniref:hypothetical protein n=1 Tax=unclassified Paraburkholderia TaxID=2615204 RepID=UPI0034CF0A5F
APNTNSGTLRNRSTSSETAVHLPPETLFDFNRNPCSASPKYAVQSTGPNSLDREVVWVSGTLTVSAPAFSALPSGAYIATWSGADGEVTGKILPSDSMGDSAQLVLTPEGTNRTVIVLGSPRFFPIPNYPPLHLG